MFFTLIAQVVSFLLTLVALRCRSDAAKDLEILMLRHQVAILQPRYVGKRHLSIV